MSAGGRLTRQERLQRSRRRARWVGGLGVAVAAALPILLWHRVISDIAHSSTNGLQRYTGWAPWTLMLLGLLCAIPIVIEDLRDRERRFHRRGTAAWAGWGVTLYLLGFALATQVASIHGLHAS